MLAKLQALLPLLGWFYLSMFGAVALIGLLRIFRQKSLSVFIERAIVALVVCVALLLTAQHIALEWKDTQIAWKSFDDTAIAKLKHDVGGNYTRYFKTFRPALSGVHDVNLIGVDIKEYLYARMYLYPTMVLEAKSITDGNTLYDIVSKSQLPSERSYTILKDTGDLVLIQLQSGVNNAR